MHLTNDSSLDLISDSPFPASSEVGAMGEILHENEKRVHHVCKYQLVLYSP